MNKLKYLVIIISIILLVGCANKNITINDNNSAQEEQVEENVEETKVFTSFNGLGNVYNDGKDINSLSEGTEIYNSKVDKPYVSGEFKEIDFANDLIQMYLIGDTTIYEYLMDEGDKDRLLETLKFLKVDQMGLDENDPLYFRLSSVVYEGKIKNEKNTAILNIKGTISRDNINFVSLMDFVVSVKVQEDNIIGNLE